MIFVFGLYLHGLEEVKQKTMGERAREGEREKEILRLLLLLPPPRFSGLTSVQLSRGCVSYFANRKKPPALQAAPVALNHYLVT